MAPLQQGSVNPMNMAEESSRRKEDDTATSAESEETTAFLKARNMSPEYFQMQERRAQRNNERQSYMYAAIAGTAGVLATAAYVIVQRFLFSEGEHGTTAELIATFALVFGAGVGMEFFAIFAHKILYHGFFMFLHESHHEPRAGPFEKNDILAAANAVPALACIIYGFTHPGVVPGMIFGTGLGITIYGMLYMFVHDGLVHRRFPVGPIEDLPFLQRVAAAHQLHHSEKYDGVPFGLFLGPQELAAVGASQDLDDLVATKSAKRAAEILKKKEKS
eukprot:jgi/Mesvir1/2082/Mv16615-RA.1